MKTAALAALLFLLPSVLRAAPLEDAKAAYDVKDYEKSFKLFKPLAEKGDAEAQYQLGMQLEQGLGTDKDNVAARRWYDKAAAQGNPGAMMWIGHTYAEGDGVSQDYGEALEWYKKAAAKKYAPAYSAIGGIYSEGQGVKKDLKESAKWYRKGAEAGDALGEHNLSVAYREGDGVGKDVKQSLKWARKAADQGCAPAMVNIGWAYFNGIGVPKDYAQAYAWYKKAADLGEAYGQEALGNMYMDGKGVPLDYAEGLRWFRLAADQGQPDALYSVGWSYLQGHGAAKDSKEALKWFQQAADAGYPAAQYYVGATYYNGDDGVAQDIAAGCRWFGLAAAQGNDDAKAMLKKCPEEGAQAAGEPPTVVAPAPQEPVSALNKPAFQLKPRPADFAVVIGIEGYRRAPRADFAESDAAAVEANLLALGVPQRNIVRIAGDDATRSRIQAYLDEWLPKNVKADSTVFFYYSGHGAPDAESGDAYLLPSDGDPAFLKTTAYPLKDVYAALNKLPARQVIVALDSCFSGGGGRSVIAKGARPLVTRRTSVDPGKLLVFAAAQGDQITGSYDADQHGLFTYYFLKGLGGEAKDKSGRVTAKGLYNYLKPLVEDEARRQNREQSPSLAGSKDAVLAKF